MRSTAMRRATIPRAGSGVNPRNEGSARWPTWLAGPAKHEGADATLFALQLVGQDSVCTDVHGPPTASALDAACRHIGQDAKVGLRRIGNALGLSERRNPQRGDVH